MSREKPTFDSLLEPVECPACGAEIDPDEDRCPVCALNINIALAPDTRPRLARWLLDGVALPAWAERPAPLWASGAAYVAALAAVPLLARTLWDLHSLYWFALAIVVALAVASWIIAATEIAADTGSTLTGGLVFVISFFLWPLAAAAAMIYLARSLPRPAARALQWANLLCFIALTGLLIADFVRWIVR